MHTATAPAELSPLPNSFTAEVNLLGAILMDNKAIEDATPLTADDFFSVPHQRVFARMVAMAESQTPIDYTVLSEELSRSGDLEMVGGAAYVASLTDGMPKVTNVKHYAKIVREKAHLRSLIYEADRVQRLAFEREASGRRLLDDAAQTFRDLAIQRTDSGPGTPDERLRNLLDDARERVGTSEPSTVIAALQSELRHILPEQDFPKQLLPIAMQGVVGKFVEAALPCTEADESCLVYQFLTAIGNVMGRHNHAIFGSDTHYPNLFTLIVGDTSAGKGQGLSAVRHLMRLVDGNWEERGSKYSAASGEAVVRLASESEDGRLFLIMPEMSVLLNSANREGSNTSGYLRLGWDGLPMENNRSRTTESARNYLLSLVGHVTPDELTEILQNVDFYNGMANRFLWAAVRKSKTLPRMSRAPNFLGLSKTIQDLLALPTIGEVDFTEEGGKLWDLWVHSLPTLEGKLGASQQRTRPNALRVAQIYAALNERRLVLGSGGRYAIDHEHVAAAIEIVTRSRESVAWFLNKPVKVEAKAQHDDVLKFRNEMNAKNGRMTNTELASLFSHKSAAQRTEIASRAGAKNRSQSSGGGKPCNLWTW